LDERRWIVDANLRGRVDWFFASSVALRLTTALAVPFIRDSFKYQLGESAQPPVFRLPAIAGDVGLGLAVQVP
jgi:hypothetical protein